MSQGTRRGPAGRRPDLRHAACLFVLLALLVACEASRETPRPVLPTASNALPSATLTPLPPTRTPRVDEGWQPLFRGAEVRTNLAGGARMALRIDPQAVELDVVYSPRGSDMQTVGGWLERSDALAALNCGFYFTTDSGENRAIGLLADQDETFSRLRSGWGGVLLVQGDRALVQNAPSAVPTMLRLGIQGWPMLVRGGRAVSGLDDASSDARTVAALDRQGRIIFLVDVSGFSLAGLARFLIDSDLEITSALNLDGGSSSGLRYRAAPDVAAQGYDSFFVPCAVLVR